MPNTPTIRSMIGFSWTKSREILFPFHFKRWFKLLILVWLAAAGIQGFSSNFNAPQKPAETSLPSQKVIRPIVLPEELSQTSPEGMPSLDANPVSPTEQAPSSSENKISALDAARIAKIKAGMEREDRAERRGGPVVFVLLMAGMVVLGAGFVLFFLWFSSRFNFVLLDTIVTRELAIRDLFKKHKKEGNSYFAWMLAFLGIVLAAFLIIGLVGMGFLVIAKGNAALSLTLGIFAAILLLVIFLGMICIGIVMRDFILPVMYREKIPATNAIHKVMKGGKFVFGKLFQYLLVILGLWILAMIVQSIVAILVVVGGAIAGGLVVIPGILLIKVLPLLKLPLIILGILVGLALVLAVIVVIGMVMLPVVIFLRVFALAYLTRLYPECDLLGFSGKDS
jgi:hypothetical protein